MSPSSRASEGPRTIRAAVPFVVLGVLLAAGCGQPAAHPAGGEIAFTIRTFERKSAGCDSNGACAHIRIDYPEIAGAPSPAARESLQSCIFGWVLRSPVDPLPLASAEAAMQAYLDAYAKFRRSFPNAMARWDADRRATILPSPPGIATLAATVFEYNGGAHPNTVTHFASLDVSNGRRLRPDDLLLAGSAPQLVQLAEQAFRRARRLPASSALADSGYWFPNGFHLPSEFAVTPQGFRFYFNAYDVAPYVMGPTDFTVPYSELSSLIRRDGLLRSKANS